MTSSSVVRGGEPPDESTDAVKTAVGLAEYGQIYLGVDVLLSAIGDGVPVNDERYRARWSCLLDLLNKATVHRAAEDAYEITSFLDRFGINPDDESGFEADVQEEHEDVDVSGVDETHKDEQSKLSDFDDTSNQRESSLSSSSSAFEARESTSYSDTLDFEGLLGQPLILKRQRFQRLKQRFKYRMFRLFSSISSDTNEARGDSYTNQRVCSRRWWWRRQRRASVFSNQIELCGGPVTHSLLTDRRGSSPRGFASWADSGQDIACPSDRSTTSASCALMESSRSRPCLVRGRTESSMTRSRGFVPYAVSECGASAVSERSRAVTSFVMMETSMSVSHLAEHRAESSCSDSRGYAPWAVSEDDPRGISERSRTAMMEMSGSESQVASTRVQTSSLRESSGIVRFFGSFRFRSAS